MFSPFIFILIWKRNKKIFSQIFLIFKRLDCSKFNADSGNVIKNVPFCYLADNFIDLLRIFA